MNSQIIPNHTCGNTASVNSAQFNINNLTFDTDQSCEPLVVGVRFIFLTRGDGFGSVDPYSPRVSEWVDLANEAWNSINDPELCQPGELYDRQANVQIELKGVHSVANTEAWNFRAAAQALPFYGFGSFCPSGIDNGNWPALKAVVDEYNTLYPETINFFFVENGDHLNYLKFHVDNGIPLTSPWPDHEDTPIFGGCSKLPGSYHEDRPIFIIEADFFTSYYLRKHFGHIYFPEYDHVPQETIAEWTFGGIGFHFNHELGHSIMQQGHSACGCKNLMEGSSCGYLPNKNHLAPSQFTRLHRVLSTTSNKNYINCDDMKDGHCDILIERDVTIQRPISVYGDLIVKSGNTLTVNSEVYLSDYSTIVVEENAKLIVDGGLLTALCDKWVGIKVYGGNDDFDVKFTGEATIEHTSDAAVSMFAPEPWPDIQNWGNGILQADQTTFNDTRRIVEFMSWSPLPNQSYIQNCVQNGGKWGVTNWNCQGIQIVDNVFNDISHYGVVSSKGSFLISGNEFNSGEQDILFNNVSASISSTIVDNTFNGENIGYNARGTTFGQNVITDNTFNTGYTDVMNDGHNQYLLASNQMTATFGSVNFDNGNGIADVERNIFSENLVGAMPIGTNLDYNFYENCYNTTFVDNYIDGTISSLIASSGSNAANNCFTHAGDVGSFVQDIGGNPTPFTYLEPDDDQVDCRDAIKAHPTVNRQGVAGLVHSPCEADPSGIGQSPGLSHCWPDPNDLSKLKQAWEWLQAEIEYSNEHPASDQGHQEGLLSHYERCLNRVRGYLFQKLVKDRKYEEARLLFGDDVTDDSYIYMFSSYVYEGDLIAARDYLGVVPSESEELHDFITIQHIELDRLPYGPFYEASEATLNEVYTIALKEHTYAGYAKALYFELTEEVISSQVPNWLIGMYQRRLNSEDDGATNPSMSVYPNPFSNSISVHNKSGAEAALQIYDLQGRVVYAGRLPSSEITLSSEQWPEGIYLFNIVHNDGSIFSKRVSLLR